MLVMDLKLTSRYEQDEAGWWVAEIPEVPGVFSQGKTREEAREMVLDAFENIAEARHQTVGFGNFAQFSEDLPLADGCPVVSPAFATNWSFEPLIIGRDFTGPARPS